MNKYLNIILSGCALLCLAACSDFLNIRTEATMPSSGLDYSKPENVIMPLSNAYASMRLGEGESLNYMAVLEIASDDADKGSSPEDGPNVKAIDEFTLDPTNGCVNDVWNYFYNISSAANYAIESMELFRKTITSAEGLKEVERCDGEARIIRAWAYFNLVRIFGPVPMVTKTMTSEELAAMKVSSEEELYNFIYGDLEVAIKNVPESYEEYPGRYTCYTARALKSKVALYRKDWNEAAKQADAVIATREFALLPNFRTVFQIKGENNTESLMEIQSSTLGQSAGDAPMCFYAFRSWSISSTAAAKRSASPPPCWCAARRRRKGTRFPRCASIRTTTARSIRRPATTSGRSTPTAGITTSASSAIRRCS